MEDISLKIKADTEQATTSIKDLRNAIKEIKDAMAGLEEGSDAWNELAHKAGEYQHQLQAIGETIRGASSDFGDMLGNVSKVGAGITGMFQTASAAMSMFGVESEEVTESIKTMQNMMAMTQGLSSIDAMIKSLKKLSASIKATTIATKALKAALQPKIFLAITAAITALVLVFKRLKKAQEEVNKVERERAEKIAKKEAEQTQKLNTNISTTIAKYKVLQNQYKNLNSSADKSKWIKNNANEFKKLGMSINSVNEADKIFIKQSEEVINALKLRAKAAAAEEALEDALKDVYKQQADIISEFYKSGNQTTQDFILALYGLEEGTDFNTVYKEINGFTQKVYEYTEKGTKKILDFLLKDTKAEEANILEVLGNIATAAKEEAESYDYLFGTDKTVSGSKYKDIDFTLQRLEYQKDINAGTILELDVIRQILKYHGDIKSANEEDLRIQQNKLEADINDAEAAKKRDEDTQNILNAEKEILKTRQDLVLTYDSLIGSYQTFNDLAKINEEIEKDEYLTAEDRLNIQYKLNSASRELLLLTGQVIGGAYSERDALNDELETYKEYLKTVEVGTKYYYETKIKIGEIKKQIQEIDNQSILTEIELREAVSHRLEGELQLLQEKYDLQEEILEQTERLSGKNSLEYKTQLLNLKAIKKEMVSVRFAAMDVANQGIGYISDMLSALADNVDTTTKEGFEKQKKLSIAATIMNGINGTINAISSWMNPANAWMTAPVQAVMAALQAAAVAATTAAQVAQIRKTQFDGGASTSSSSVNSLTLVPPTQYTQAVQGANIEENTKETKSYVSVTEIEKVSNRVSVAESESRY